MPFRIDAAQAGNAAPPSFRQLATASTTVSATRTPNANARMFWLGRWWYAANYRFLYGAIHGDTSEGVVLSGLRRVCRAETNAQYRSCNGVNSV